MSDGWLPIENVHPDESKFPIRSELGGEKIVVLRTGDSYRAIQRYCPHQHTDLSRGMVVGNGAMIRCGLHAYTFKLSDGTGVNCPGYTIDVYEVKRDGDRLLGRRIEKDDLVG